MPSPVRLRARRFAGAGALLLAVALAACGPSDPLDEAKQLQAEGKPVESLEKLRGLVESGSEDPEVFYLYGLALLGNNQASLSQWPLRRAMESPEWLVRAGLALAGSAVSIGNYDEAIRAIDRVLEAEPDHVGALIQRSVARCYSRRDYEGALADAERALELEPDNAEALIPRAVALMGLLRVDEAQAALDELDRRSREEGLNVGITAVHCAARASFRKEKGEVAEADRIYADCLERYPTAAMLVQDAIGFYDSQNRFDRSLEVLRAAYDDDRTVRIYRVPLVTRLDAAGQREEAERILREATEIANPTLAAAGWADLAGYYLGRGDAEQAIPAYEQAMSAGEPSPDLVFAYAEALILGRRFERALEVAGGMTVPAQRELIRARVEQEQGRPREALARFTEALRLWPDNAVARYYAARAAEQAGDFDRAVEEYRFSLRSDPAATDARLRLARLYLAEGEVELALTILRHDVVRSGTAEAVLLELEVVSRRGAVKKLPDYIEHFARTPVTWPRAVAAIAAGTRRRAGPEAAAEVVRAERLDLTHPVNAPALRELAAALVEAGQAKQALELADAAVKAHPDAPALHEIRGLALAGSGDAGDARAAYERAVELDPENAAALSGLARLAAQAGDADAALDLYARAAAADRDDASALVASAELLASRARSEAAERHLVQALDRDPLDGKTALRLAELRLARGADAQETRALLERAVRFRAGPKAQELLERAGAAPPPPGPAAGTP